MPAVYISPLGHLRNLHVAFVACVSLLWLEVALWGSFLGLAIIDHLSGSPLAFVASFTGVTPISAIHKYLTLDDYLNELG